MQKAIVFLTTILLVCSSISYCHADTIEEAAKEAQTIHKKALSDIIYTQDELKALYYQNIQIIELLKDIRALLKESLIKAEEQKD